MDSLMKQFKRDNNESKFSNSYINGGKKQWQN